MKKNELEKLTAYLENLSDTGFYGRVIIRFQNGLVDTILTESLQRLDSLPAPGDKPASEPLTEIRKTGHVAGDFKT